MEELVQELEKMLKKVVDVIVQDHKDIKEIVWAEAIDEALYRVREDMTVRLDELKEEQ